MAINRHGLTPEQLADVGVRVTEYYENLPSDAPVSEEETVIIREEIEKANARNTNSEHTSTGSDA